MSAFAFFAGCSGEKPDDVIRVISPENPEEVILDNDEVKDFFDNYTRCYSSKQVGKGDVYFMSDVVLEWTADGAERYVLTVADNENFTSAREIETPAAEYKHDKLENVDGGKWYEVKLEASHYVENGKINGFRFLDCTGSEIWIDSVTVYYAD